MNRRIRFLLILGLLLTTTHRLPAPISEIPEPTATAKPKTKSKPPAKTQITSTEKTHAADELSAKTKTATPRVSKNTRTEKAKPSPAVPAQQRVSGQLPQFPTAKAVPGKPGFVFSPFVSYPDPDNNYVDVRGFVSGTEVRDPFTGKIFLVP